MVTNAKHVCRICSIKESTLVSTKCTIYQTKETITKIQQLPTLCNEILSLLTEIKKLGNCALSLLILIRHKMVGNVSDKQILST